MEIILRLKNGTEDSINFGELEEIPFEFQGDFLEVIKQGVMNNSELRIGKYLETKTTWSEVKSVEILLEQ